LVNQKKIEKAASMQIKKTLTTAPPPIEAKVDFFKQVQDLKDQHEKHEEKKEIHNLEK
jgi:hypothetical protein